MRSSLVILICCTIAVSTNAQVTITSTNLPQAGNLLVTNNAVLVGQPDYTTTGQNHTWNFGSDAIQLVGGTTNTMCYNVDNTPIVYQFLFNNPFDPQHNSDFGIGVEAFSLAGLSFSNAYQYHKITGSKYTITGLGASINGLPLAAQKNPTELVYNLPLQPNTSGTSTSVMIFDVPSLAYFRQELTRSHTCDGWGTLNLLGNAYEVLRVKTTINATDSIYTDFLGFGFTLPEPESVLYEWLSPQFKVPVLRITTTAGVVSQVQVADIFNSQQQIESVTDYAYPNPTTGVIRWLGNTSTNSAVLVYDQLGALSATLHLTNGYVDISALPQGIYTVVMNTAEATKTQRIIKQ